MGQAPAEVQALLREHTTTHQVNELHYLKKLPADPTLAGVPMIVFLNGAGERGPADGSELDRACMHGVLKVAMAGPSEGPGLPGTILSGWVILNPQLHVESMGGWLGRPRGQPQGDDRRGRRRALRRHQPHLPHVS